MHTSGVDHPRRPRWKSMLLNVGILVSTMVSGALASNAADIRLRHATLAHPTTDGSSAGIFLLSWACAIVLCFRHRRGVLVPVALLACIPPLFLPIDALGALIALTSVLVWCRSLRLRVLVGIFVTTATAVSIWRDGRGVRPGASFWTSLLHSGSQAAPPLAAWQVALFTVLCVGTSVGIGFVRRTRRHAARADARAEAASRSASTLGRQVAELDEREALAREVHDVLGHRLSLLSMQANALEVEATGVDENLRERARLIQSGASGSMDDLRSLLQMLRDGPAPLERPGDLTDIADLVQECLAAGTPVASNVFVDQSQPLDPVVSRSAHRIVAELLTNARKHAPGAMVTLEVRGDPRAGLTITTANPMTSADPGLGSGSGLIGVSRRALDIGGTFTAGPTPDGRRFLATAHMPWQRPTPRQESR